MARVLRCRKLLSACSGNRCVSSDSARLSSNTAAASETSAKIPPHPSQIRHDMIGPPNQLSNLRPVVFHKAENETPLEQQFRLERERVQRWNEEFWIKHNTAFVKEGNEFRTKKLGSSKDSDKKSLNAEEMSEFYKAFLDKNWKTHVSYNFEWYRKNFSLLILAFRVQLSKIGVRGR
ncbi:hypothetical protein ONE63_007481 [Megalurothrips usitatus]|uniref:APOPT family protein CG14806, mitochondrial n=1 Tax=Megalurothrips usitatus TaxID=439358 RepID=A0AAV7XMV5_9NEOP|nr:hypothetical protein ONE63_007481 [Megalurothrips usitatus]